MSISTKKYLTEKSLIQFLLEKVDSSGICNKALKPYKFRPDYVSTQHMIIVEFDGYLHYTKSKTILDDSNKDKIFSHLGYKIIRIPYFVQLDKRVMHKLFGDFVLDSFDYVDYPHGFIDSKAVLPADFCSLGVQRFKSDLERFDFIRDEILKSLYIKPLMELEVFPLDFHRK
jgi:hypothetical protein